MALVIVLIGATGVGKTELSLRIAERFGAEIFSADSRQMFRGIEIGTAAPTAEELGRVKHHFVGQLELTDYYSAAEYEVDAWKAVRTSLESRQVALITGGSMLYIDTFCNGIDDLPRVSEQVRLSLLEEYHSKGSEWLQEELRQLDPTYYEQVDRCNPKRVLHAVEICRMTGKPYSSFRTGTKKERPFPILKIGLSRDREELYERINRRVDQMIDRGLIEEARSVFPYAHLNSLNTVGYKELFAHFRGDCSLDEAIEKIKQHSRIYSRKQTTWFKRDQSIHWFHPDQQDEIFRACGSF